jgi:ABC-type bacteriocin/lantibiotic exporter with double-glycine peptidase domain
VIDRSNFVTFNRPVGWKISSLAFTYPGAHAEAIHGLSLDIKPGQAAVIIGPSGAGKSTLLALLLGVLRPSSGTIDVSLEDVSSRLDGTTQPLLLHNIGYVGAESFLIEGTIRQNLLYGLRGTPTEAQIADAVRKAECGFIQELPQGLEHCLTDQGQGLSAGQKQRLGLARALLRNPRALILDEATANLDLDTEMRLVQTLVGLKGQMTIIGVTHRQALLEIADQTVRMQ